MVIPSANSWTRYTNNARDDPSWLAHPLRDDKLQPSLKRKTARISRTLSIAEKENHEDVVMTSTPDGACEKQSLQSSGLAEASVLPWQGAPIVVGYAVWAGADPMAYATPLPYFNGCTGADRTLMHGVNELSVLRGAAREAAHTISGVFELESAGAPAQLAAVDEALPPWRMVEASFWLD
ncbi:uncharacterized protein SCHCODRAFT_01162453 [Schizophyllum commune H4-8]|uniref:Expressed protein n=1 Tax=Schizophyllum commune (strain H4-8 / FGSC 9210) TaxID=578458 RepID=D8QIT3_SCHCM|nr:uncharacterized protein SCHCODRAFT_01162453 [Schizophyllum commune H4-8]KAI5886138.1 hypothetical protein SCHCODRAFT_01162453 [Schizophyllum commune H4-8]